MAETVSNHDFIELNYTGTLEDGMVFDTTSEDVAHEAGLPHNHGSLKPAIVCVGEKQLLPGLDAALTGKEVRKEFSVTLEPEQAFGKRDVKKVKIVPMNTFKEHKVQPQPGLQIDVDGERGTVSRVSGGRVIVNFNHPLAGKKVTYTATVVRKVTDTAEKIAAFIETMLRMPLKKEDVTVAEKKVTVTLPMALPPQLTTVLGDKLKELLGLESVEFTSKSAPVDKKE